jgi:ankyrin repeat protein
VDEDLKGFSTYELMRLDKELLEAAERGDARKIRELLGKGANPNTRDEHDWTPLHNAAFNDRLDVVRLLLEHGADPGIGDDWGRTPLDRAREGGYVEVARVIEEYGRGRAGGRGVPARSSACS